MFSVGLKEHYENSIRPSWKEREKLSSLHAVPRLRYIVLNMGVGKSMQDKSVMESIMRGLAAISGQKPRMTMAKKSIAAFRLREGVPLGLKVTLRGPRMYHFLQRLILVAMPRIRDFRGVLSRSFDGNGNFSFGLKESDIFPEATKEEIMGSFGMDISIITSAKTDADAKKLLELFGIPFRS